MTNQLNFDTRGKLTVRDTASRPVKIVIKLAKKGNGRIVGDRQYQICRYVETINDRQCPGKLTHGGDHGNGIKIPLIDDKSIRINSFQLVRAQDVSRKVAQVIRHDAIRVAGDGGG